METGSAKRRKLGHGTGGPTFESMASASVGAGSSSFVLETDELLQRQQVDYPDMVPLLREYKEAIEGTETHAPSPVSIATKKFEKTNNILIPYPDPKPEDDSNYKLSFEAPRNVNVVGSFSSRTMVKSQADKAVDMIVEMPSSIFQQKDYRDLRYFYKRAYYLAKIAAALRSKFPTAEHSYSCLNGNPLLPILVTRSQAISKKKSQTEASSLKHEFEVRVIPCAPEGLFPIARLSSTSCNVRDSNSVSSEDTSKPTPYYNATIKAESCFSEYLRLLRTTEKKVSEFKDACMLGRIWLQQRGFTGEAGFGHFHWAVLMALLLQTGGRKGEPVLAPSLHATQLFKATLHYLASSKLDKQSLVLGPRPSDTDSIRYPGPVLYDGARQLNILYNTPTWTIDLLIQNAKWSLAAVNSSTSDQFHSLFIAKVNQPLMLYDLVVKVDIPSHQQGTIPAVGKGHLWAFADRVYQILHEALGARARLVHVDCPAEKATSIAKASSKFKPKSLIVGIILDPENASLDRDFGPSQEEKKEATKFRKFWGEKAGLWQFRDGRIVEHMDWTAYREMGSNSICQAIIRHVLERHLKLREDDFHFHGQESSAIHSFGPSDDNAFKAAREAFETFQADMFALEDVPLQIRQVTAIDSALRYAAVRIPDVDSTKWRTIPAMDVIVTFESSTKWPQNLAAIQRAKAAFLVSVANGLRGLKEGIQAVIGMEETELEIENTAFLDVVYEGGLSFRLRIFTDLEETLLDRQRKDPNLDQRACTEAADTLAIFSRMYDQLPRHTQAIATLCTRMPALSTSIRLTKQWFESNRLGNHFNEVLIELLVLRVFLEPCPFPEPTSGMIGFHRTLLFLASWDWAHSPLIIEYSPNEISASQRKEINNRFSAYRKTIDEKMNNISLFLATNMETRGDLWTSGIPQVIANRMTRLAGLGIAEIREKGLGLDAGILFYHQLKGYQVIVHLKQRAVKEAVRSFKHKSIFKNLDDVNSKDAVPLLASPVQVLVRQLSKTFGNVLIFFGGGAGDYRIPAIWNPNVRKRKNPSANMPANFMPTLEHGEVVYDINRPAILAEIARIGGDMIDRIEHWTDGE
ncbi:Nrap protein [Xylariaceae sp. FL0016]|nr:Nrap protein [Xylariaceae sp. FL0016]